MRLCKSTFRIILDVFFEIFFYLELKEHYWYYVFVYILLYIHTMNCCIDEPAGVLYVCTLSTDFRFRDDSVRFHDNARALCDVYLLILTVYLFLREKQSHTHFFVSKFTHVL